jgi:uncharacterized protein (DUF779 family)
MIERVIATPAALELIAQLKAEYGDIMFHQSGGCCDGSAPMCYLKGEFRVGAADVLLGELEIDGIDEPIRVWISLEQFEYWKHTHIEIDLTPGRGAGFSLEAPEGFRFIIRSRIFTDAEYDILKHSEVMLGDGSFKLV